MSTYMSVDYITYPSTKERCPEEPNAQADVRQTARTSVETINVREDLCNLR